VGERQNRALSRRGEYKQQLLGADNQPLAVNKKTSTNERTIMIKTSINKRQTSILIAASILLLAASPLRASETDDRIESSAKKSYVFKHYLTGDSIKTESKNGAVTLTGTVAEESHIGLARDTVSGLPGVKSVDNRLVVKGEAPAEQSDTWVGLKVKSALLFHRNVRATKTDVNVKDGIVILSGEASSVAQK
jgi:hyperosmotically inducible periplasmic protein